MNMPHKSPAPDVDIASLLVGVSSNLKLTALDEASREQIRLNQEVQKCQAAALGEISKQTALLGEQLDTQKKLLASQELQTKLALLAEARRVKQLELRNAVFGVKEEIERIRKLTDPIACYFHMSLLGKDTDTYRIRPSEFEDLRDKEFAAEVLTLFSAAKEEVSGRLGAEDWDAIRSLQKARVCRIDRLRELEDTARKIQEISTQLSETRPVYWPTSWAPPSARLITGLRVTAWVLAGIGGIIAFLVFGVAEAKGDSVALFLAVCLIAAAFLLRRWAGRLSEMPPPEELFKQEESRTNQIQSQLRREEARTDEVRSQLQREEEAIRQFVDRHPELSGFDFI